MITRSPSLVQRSDAPSKVAPQSLTLQTHWQSQLSRAIRDPHELCRRLEIDDGWLPGAESGHALFEVRVPEAFLARMRPGDPHDPLLRQVLPLEAEGHQVSGDRKSVV